MTYKNPKLRVKALQTLLGQYETECYICRLKANIEYFLGRNEVGEGLVLIIPASHNNILFVPKLEASRIESEKGEYRTEILKPSEDVTLKLSSKLKEHGISKVAFDTLSFKDFKSLDGKFKVEYIPDLPMKLRRVKDEYEIHMIRKAAELTDKGLQAASDYLKAGVNEIQVAAEAEYAMRTAGSGGISFDTIVASGLRSSYPHGEASVRKIKEDEPVIVDIGAKFEGYCADVSRTFFVGKPSNQQRKVYRIVYDAQTRSLDGIREGLEGCEADSLARQFIQKHSYGEYFLHGLGHGVGLEVHEPPALSTQSHEKLEKRNTITVEPGIYLPGKFGVRIEDTVMVAEKDVKLLSKFEKAIY